MLEIVLRIFLLSCAGLALAACAGSGDDEAPTSTSLRQVDAGATAPNTSGQPATSPTAAPTSAARIRLNLNSASGNDFTAAIPGFTSRFVTEFLEYRPYVSIQQFRRELGKYVGAQQITEWEKYVYVPVDVNNADAETLKQLPGVTDAVAGQLTSSRPYASNDAFLTRLGQLVSASDAAAAKALLK